MTTIIDKSKETTAETDVGGVHVTLGAVIAGAKVDTEGNVVKIEGNIGPFLGGLSVDYSSGLPILKSYSYGEGIIAGISIGSIGASGNFKVLAEFDADGQAATGIIKIGLNFMGKPIVAIDDRSPFDPRHDPFWDNEI
jgi:hypothetical protein